MPEPATYDVAILPEGIRSRFVAGVNGLNMHVLEAGYEAAGRPCVLLLHGFPELAYSWRKIMLPLAAAGFHVVAPDQRGYGRTTGWDDNYDGDLGSFRMLNLVRDTLGLVAALGYRSVAAVIGHDFGSPLAAYCALIRPQVFRAVALMSAPFGGPPALPFNTANRPEGDAMAVPDIHAALAALPQPRKHYHRYYSSRRANGDMRHSAQGLHAFLRAYYHHKSADWAWNKPFPLAAWTADELARMPTYYIMNQSQSMAETVADEMPTAGEIAACQWLTEAELAVYAGEFARTGFQGGLQWYRCRGVDRYNAELEIFSGCTIDVPACFIAGVSDWGVRQVPGALEAMQDVACTNMLDVHLLDGAGHWVQQEQAAAVSALLLQFLQRSA
ncbi:MAG: alpha/beta fold hydrolase [Alphaproteobacteria bacterium]|nr:alpha/beta fold hydrolase [Alphaproteobacteria bacterium]